MGLDRDRRFSNVSFAYVAGIDDEMPVVVNRHHLPDRPVAVVVDNDVDRQ